MAIEFSKAVDALNKAANLGGGPGMEARDATSAGQFAKMLEQFSEQAVEAGKTAEQATAAAVQGKADLTEVVQAVTNAEVTLQTVVAVRDRIISAYQQILRMPI